MQRLCQTVLAGQGGWFALRCKTCQWIVFLWLNESTDSRGVCFFCVRSSSCTHTHTHMQSAVLSLGRELKFVAQCVLSLKLKLCMVLVLTYILILCTFPDTYLLYDYRTLIIGHWYQCMFTFICFIFYLFLSAPAYNELNFTMLLYVTIMPPAGGIIVVKCGSLQKMSVLLLSVVKIIYMVKSQIKSNQIFFCHQIHTKISKV